MAVDDDATNPGRRVLPPVLGSLLNGSGWLALQVPLQIVLSLWSLRLILGAIGPDGLGAYRFAFGFGGVLLLFDFGVNSALQQQISRAWTRRDQTAVDRAIASGMNCYLAVALLQVIALVGVAYLAVPFADFEGESYRLVVKLLWLQALTAPFLGLSVVFSCVLQAARRYEFVPVCELAITLLRFVILVLGVKVGADFFLVVLLQYVVVLTLRTAPLLWVIVRELKVVPRFHGARLVDYAELGRFSFYLVLIQISIVLSDRIDTTVLGFMLARPGPAIAVYDVVSKPYLLLRQSGSMMAFMVMPAVASLAAAGDERGLERVPYDGTRLHVGALLPVGLLAWIYAGPFLSLWFGTGLGYDAAKEAPLMRLCLVAAIPLVLAVPVQASIGVGKIKVIATSALAGALLNVPISCYLTARLGVAGVIWGTVLTTLVSNLLVPGLYVFRVLAIEPRVYLWRSLAAPLAGSAALVASTWFLRLALPITDHSLLANWTRALPLILHLGVGGFAYTVGYSLLPAGCGDLAGLIAKLRRHTSRPVAPAADD